MGIPFLRLDRCKGINNIDSLIELPFNKYGDPDGSFLLSDGNNIDISNTQKISRRDGSSTLVYSGNVNSMFSGLDTCLFMRSGTLHELKTDFTSTVLLSNLDPNSPMNYVEVADRIYFTNNSVIGYVSNSTATLLSIVASTFKRVMPPGHLIEYYHNRLYVVNGSVLYFSDAGALSQYDIRKNMRPFPSRIRMIQAVGDGIYVSDQDNIYFMDGPDPLEMSLVEKCNYPVIHGGFKKITGENIGPGESSGTFIFMATSKGFCVGGNGGSFKNVTGEYYKIDSLDEVTSSFRFKTGTSQFIILGKTTSNIGNLNIDIPEPVVIIH